MADGGGGVQLETYRGQRNLVVVCGGNGASRPGRVTSLLNGLLSRKDELEAEAAQVLAVVVTRPAEPPERGRWPFPLLVDREALFHRTVGATDGTRNPTDAVFITDRFREIYAIYVPAHGSVWPGPQEIVDWLEFINIQCPECGVPEWPA
jgi:hypothetical protein